MSRGSIVGVAGGASGGATAKADLLCPHTPVGY